MSENSRTVAVVKGHLSNSQQESFPRSAESQTEIGSGDDLWNPSGQRCQTFEYTRSLNEPLPLIKTEDRYRGIWTIGIHGSHQSTDMQTGEQECLG